MKSGKYILQYGSLAGWPFNIAEALREQGVPSQNVIHWYKDVADLKRKLPYDRALNEPTDNIVSKFISIPKFIHEISKDCSLVHYHGTNVFFRELHSIFEGPFLNQAGVPMLMSFGGGDARILKMANDMNPHFYRKNDIFHDFFIKMRHKAWSKNIKYCATNPEMAFYAEPYFEKVFSFRQPVNLDNIKLRYPSKDNTCPLLLHIPTESQVKGTDSIIEAVRNLKERGLNFSFRTVRGLSQAEVYEEMEKCDVYIDELKCGDIGVTAVEAMAAGKPTVSWILPAVLERYPSDFPIVTANPDTIENVLASLIDSAETRNLIGKRSRSYVEKHHDIKIVVEDLMKIYDEIS